MAHVTAIVPTYNRAALMVDCIDSLLEQSRPPDRVLVVDDGSTDDTVERLRSYASRIHFVTQKNSGKSAALNHGLSVVGQTDYIWICDDDDIADRLGLERLLDCAMGHPQAPFVYGTYKRFRDTPSGRVFEDAPFEGREGEDSFLIQSLEETFAFQFAQLVKRETYEAVGPFRADLPRSIDFEMNIRLARYGVPVRIPDVIFFQRIHSGDRGPASARFKADEALSKWARFGAQITRDATASLELASLRPYFARDWSGDDAKRSELLQRGLIFAQRMMWSEALDDLEACASLAPAGTLPSRGEIQIAESVVRARLALIALQKDKAAMRRLRDLHRRSDYARLIVSAAMRPLVWNARKSLREGLRREAASFLQTLIFVLGPAGALRRIRASLVSGRPAGQ
ncbi:glycosyltransferase family 2 protein [Wenxinia marina]|uniref:Putative glycosyltransferase n=1 Tax=Wenxinia marina DSM 24838 TaxID=1123501 RepID=A0A0D0Q441_9RHOB|nr:glycosyltransferase [Wenxinia marina]KIQ69279.1 putative glycosyltransferase [Wenxinia marina DSM 24838]GGL71772.1 hypothetical protein GCM10011392_27970 [Wenxinia marina]